MLLGIDIGTSAVKVVLVDEDGRVRAGASHAYDFDVPRPGWTQTPASRWWQATVAALAGLDGHSDRPLAEVTAVGLSGQMHGAVLLDEAAIAGAGSGPIDAVRPVIMWNDQRTADQLAAIEAAAGGRRALTAVAGTRALAGFTLPKILWVREHEPELFARVRSFTCPKDFVRLQLTGDLAIDVSEAAGSLLLDVPARRWNLPLAESLGLDPAILPPVFESCAVAGRVSLWAAAATGLREGIPVVAGAGDNQCGAAGAGVVREGLVLATLGTSGVIYAHAGAPRADTRPAHEPDCGRAHLMCAADGTADAPGGWSITGCVLSAAGALQWAREVIAPTVPYDVLMHEASLAPPGCEGLRFLPHLAGERAPFADPEARGGWIGLSLRHGRGHLVRSVLEGVTATMAMVLRIVGDLPVPVDRVRLGGGGNRSELWRRMQADLYGVPVASMNVEEGPAFGAALMAGVGSGLFESLPAAADASVHETEVLDPSPPSVYTHLLAEQEAIYHALQPRFAQLARSQ